jgi:CO/xanthine dehydrogenase FAD-binding subunit
VTLEADAGGLVVRPAIAVGACSEVAQRLPRLEARLAGKPLRSALADLLHSEDLAALAPISDVRGTADYRRDTAGTLIRRALAELSDE